ncbi:MAG TPA: hypothetical protein VF405_05710 [Gammaproteobacteria bacterium]
MRKRKFEWRGKLPAGAYEELEVWTSVLLALAAGLLLYATLTAQTARAAEFPSDVGAPTLVFPDSSGSFTKTALDNSMPAGAQWQAAFPKTATPGPLLRWLGAITLIVAGLLIVATHLPTRTGMPAVEQRREQLPRKVA